MLAGGFVSAPESDLLFPFIANRAKIDPSGFGNMTKQAEFLVDSGDNQESELSCSGQDVLFEFQLTQKRSISLSACFLNARSCPSVYVRRWVCVCIFPAADIMSENIC